MNEPLVYIIVLNYNGYADTIECVESLEKIHYKNYKLLIVDNNSTDNSYEILKNKCRQHTVVRTSKNLGYAAGNNVGIKIALRNKADYVMVLNNDTVVNKDFLNEMLIFADTKTVVVPKIYSYYKKNILSCAGNSLDWEKGVIVECGRGQKEIGRFDTNRYANTFNGCCFLIHKNIIRKVGFMSENYFLYLEDNDYAERILEKNIKIMYCYKSVIWHKESVSTNKSGVKNYYFLRNRFLLFYKFRHKCPTKVWINNLFEFISFVLIGGKKVQRLMLKDIMSILNK